MGLYVNPTNSQTKEDFLAEYGKEVSKGEVAAFVHDGKTFPVVMVDNGTFTAAAVGEDAGGRDRLLTVDGRPKRYFLVKGNDLIDFGGAAGLARFMLYQPE